ncbi:MAG TPA: hypothetical protein VGW38_15300 [Chloroflexota bacterium]|nr:hypothetical protein [Chloroflexota bacterium]
MPPLHALRPRAARQHKGRVAPFLYGGAALCGVNSASLLHPISPAFLTESLPLVLVSAAVTAPSLGQEENASRGEQLDQQERDDKALPTCGNAGSERSSSGSTPAGLDGSRGCAALGTPDA